MAPGSEIAICILSRLPKELLHTVLAYLANRDIKNLRATCRAVRDVAHLRLGRVFLSANSLNIQVFRAVANHDAFRHGVTEIIWDDARLLSDADLSRDRIRSNGQRSDDTVAGTTDCPRWFSEGRQNSLEHCFNVSPTSDNKLPDHVLTLESSWSYYKQLLQDQVTVLESASDVQALKYGLQRFPSLKRITLTPAAHGVLLNPVYESPMIRSFPEGFGYPLPRGWPRAEHHSAPIEAFPWQGSEHQRLYGPDCSIEDYREKWRGFRVLTRTLAETEHQVSEFIVNVHHMDTGINCHIFDQPCREYDDFAALLKKPGFRRLHLALFTGFLEHENWVSYRSGYLREALAEAKDLEHIALSSTMDIDANGFPAQIADPEDFEEDLLLPLQTIFPIDRWPRLKHFGLSQFLVKQSDLVSLLEALPDSLRSLELSYLAFLDGDDCYKNLLCEIRDTLDWRKRSVAQRPKVTIALQREMHQTPGRFVLVDKAADSFLYSDGLNPFGECDYSNNVVEGRGAVERHRLDPSFERAYRLNDV
ncbi:hypothetical protein QQS21_001522 [Conoideocrella luteorostrata]|uniref:F-box domain-containing protein n=1 Tax=Conoideocrella luteorostrata TaxID=1105319 RepID=A0AAJ0FY52_9HYPO|nr:hypothetical protein QQS21_001522 [Conoideocrella luteorostrata]